MSDDEISKLVGGQAPAEMFVPKLGPGDIDASHGKWVPYNGADVAPGATYRWKTPTGVYEAARQGDQWLLTGSPKAPTRAAGASAYQPADAIAPHASAAEKAQYDAIRKDPTSTPQDMISAAAALRTAEKEGLTASGKDADTQALAKAAQAKIGAGQGSSLTQTELTAYFKVHGGQASGQPSQWQMPVDGYTQPLNPHHAGNPNGAVDFEVPLGTPVKAMAGGTVVMSKDYGTAGPTVMLKTDDGHTVMYQHLDEQALPPDGATVKPGDIIGRVGPVYPGEHSTGPHLHVAIDQNGVQGFETDNGTATGFDTLGFVKSLAGGQQPASGGNPFMSTKPEIHALGDKLYQYDPASGQWSVAVDASGLKAPTTHQIGNTLYQWDPNSKQWKQAIKGPKTAADIQAEQAQQGKFLTLLQQADTTRSYIKQQYLSGTITAQQMADYGKSLDAYTQAALQGTSPWEMHVQEQQLENNRAATAKDLLDTNLTQTNTAANDLLSHAITGATQSKYGVMPGNTLSDLYQGSLQQSAQQAKPLTDLAQTLLHGIGAHAQAAGLDPRLPVAGAASGAPTDTNPLDQFAMRLPGMEGSNVPVPQPQPVAA